MKTKVTPKVQVRFAVYRRDKSQAQEKWIHMLTWGEERLARIYRKSLLTAQPHLKSNDVRIFKAVTTFEEIEL